MIIEISENEAREIIRKYSPSIMGYDGNIQIMPYKPNEALYIEIKNKKLINAFIKKLPYNKPSWEIMLNYPNIENNI